MQVLILTPNVPYPPHSGSALRAFGLIRGLVEARSRDRIAIHLLAFHDSPIPPDVTPLKRYCASVTVVEAPQRGQMQRIRTLATTTEPDMALRLSSDAMRRALEALLAENRFDAALYVGLETAIYLGDVRRMQPGCAQIYDAANVEHVLQKRIAAVDRMRLRRLPASFYSSLQVGRIRRLEQRLCESADAVVAVSARDAQDLQAFRPGRDIAVVDNGIFVDDYAHGSPDFSLAGSALVFTGKMDYRPNVDAAHWFAADIMGQVLEAVPDARLYIVGQRPHPSLGALQAGGHIDVTGWVPDIAPFLHAASVYVSPLRMGSGTRLKLLEAMAAGCAIVSTRLGAEGLSSDALAAMRLADSAGDFAAAIIDFLHLPETRQALGKQALETVSRCYDWSVIIPRLLSVLDGLSHAN